MNANQKPSILNLFAGRLLGIEIQTLFTLFCRRSRPFLIRKLAASCFESQKTGNSNIIIGKKCFVQTKNYSNRRYFCVMIEGFSFIWASLEFLKKVTVKNFGGGTEKSPTI